jgi:hypothetical protein
MKRAVVFLLVLVVVYSVFTVSALAEDTKTYLSNEFDTIVKTHNANDVENALIEAGWKKIPQKQVLDPMAAEPAGCVTIDHTVWKKTSGGVTSYHLQARWDWDDTATCKPNSGSGKVPDVIAVGLVDQNQNSVNVQAEEPRIMVYDEDGNPYLEHGGSSDIFSSGATYTITDTIDKDGHFIGAFGFAYFEVDKPSGATKYYLKSKYVHTSASSSVGIKKFEISYPWSVTLEFNSTTTVDKLEKAWQTEVKFD